jgi:3,5-epimerase/4-reductase
MNKKIIILGEGFIGKNLSDHFTFKNISHDILSKSKLNYNDTKTLSDYLKKDKNEIKCVINCSGYTGVPNVDACELEQNKDLCWNLNASYPIEIVKVCHLLKIPLIHVGSGCIYNGYDKEYSESDYPNFGLGSNYSSYYSKCKHSFECMANGYDVYIFRIRIPFTDKNDSKNYFVKLLKYNTLINELNSITSVRDFNNFVEAFINKLSKMPYGTYNVVNPQPIKAEEVVDLLKKYNLKNPNWEYISLSNLNTKAKRSNCVLNSDKIKKLGLGLPDTLTSLERDIKTFLENYEL